MIQVIVEKQRDDIVGFRMEGHSGYAESGSDIVCAAVSALAINCVNSIEKYAEDRFTLDTDEEEGRMSFQLEGKPSGEAQLLLQSMVLGVTEISRTYGKQYVTLKNR